MNKDQALKAADAAFQTGLEHMHQVFVDGLLAKTEVATLKTRFRLGLATHAEARRHIGDVIEAYFKE